MRVGILTSVETRHRFFANALREAVNVVAVGYERTGYSPAETHQYDLTPEEEAVVAQHFEERARQEEAFFGHDANFVEASEACAVLHIERGRLNTRETLAFLEEVNVEAVVVYGTNLIRELLISRWPGRMLNMHLGLSPYYRGTATNFYPLLNEEPEYIGATIHLIDSGIDSGPIVRHRRPQITEDDQPHTIGCKAILAGIEGMIASLEELEQGEMKATPQWTVPRPRLYLRGDYHPRHVVELYRKLERGLIPRYVERAEEASAKLRLID
jgi:methionyl-tRNA formyltransferase